MATLGIGASLARPRGIGTSLAAMGADEQGEATRLLGTAAGEETRRNITNEQIVAQNKQGIRQLGGTLGSIAGFAAGGPVGSLIGGTLGSLGGSLFG